MGQIFTCCINKKLYYKEKSYYSCDIFDDYKYIHSYNRNHSDGYNNDNNDNNCYL